MLIWWNNNMFCANCSKLSIIYLKKVCMRCQSEVLNNISVLCETCSLRDKICSACLKIVGASPVSRKRGCGCGK